MSYRIATAVLLALTIVFAGAGLVQGQSDKPTAEKKEVKKEETKKDEAKKDEANKEAEKAEDPPLTSKEFHDLMEDMKKAWNRLKIHARNKMGDKAAEAADELAALAAKARRYDGEVLTGENKGKKARDQKDFQDWCKAMEDAAREYAAQAKKSKWDKADAQKDKINETCGACHDVYQPEEDE
ncbi:MAG: cytochrome c [Planctomycetota bacterium]|nr:cytochrome c [Planctomycetota bacterium]